MPRDIAYNRSANDPANNTGGSGSPVSRGTWIGGTVVALLFLIAAVILFSRFGASTGARATLLTYEVLSDSSVRVSLDVARPKGETAICAVKALGADGQSVADSLVQVPPGTSTSTIFTQDIRTDGRAVSAQVGECTGRVPTPDPSGPP